MNDENIIEQEYLAEPSIEESAQGGVAVSDDIPQITEEMPVVEQSTETDEQSVNTDVRTDDIEKQIAEQQKQDEKLLMMCLNDAANK